MCFAVRINIGTNSDLGTIVTLTSGDGAASHNDDLGLCPNRNDDHGRRDDPSRGHRRVRGRP